MIYFVLINYDLIVRLYSNSFCNIFLSNGGSWLHVLWACHFVPVFISSRIKGKYL